ncbi:hypothetical protein DPMN_116076 [Dreissena polymorpha]|uniref:Uncharacterized protein n=1 Tax=Dreissena polymorpha TaxID=45954 RepID=A0A9D4QT76_DREPO|nr:hypothetical protein DPMN_116076 [Dreissena polymorpha]
MPELDELTISRKRWDDTASAIDSSHMAETWVVSTATTNDEAKQIQKKHVVVS